MRSLDTRISLDSTVIAVDMRMFKHLLWQIFYECMVEFCAIFLCLLLGLVMHCVTWPKKCPFFQTDNDYASAITQGFSLLHITGKISADS